MSTHSRTTDARISPLYSLAPGAFSRLILDFFSTSELLLAILGIFLQSRGFYACTTVAFVPELG
jgi:hypothetical protein